MTELKPMTAHRAIYFMERFKKEEKLLGPNEQAAVDFVIAMLEAAEQQAQPSECQHKWVRDDDAPLHHCCQKCGAVKSEGKQAQAEAVPAVKDGHKKRQWVRCRTCGRVAHYDYVPYSLSAPIMTMPCGHGAGERDMGADRITPEQAFAVMAAPKQAEAVPQWQPIETAPKNGTDFVAAYALQGFVKRIVRWSTVHGQWQSHGEWLPGFASNATHWMPLPAAPQPKGGE